MVDHHNDSYDEAPGYSGEAAAVVEPHPDSLDAVYAELVSQTEKMASGLLNELNQLCTLGTRRYLSDVFLPKDARAMAQTIQSLQKYGESRRAGLFGFFVDGDHIHVIHDCAFSTKSCRDKFRDELQQYGQFRPARRFNRPLWQFGRNDWLNVLHYFFSKEGEANELWVAGKNWQVPDHDEHIRWTKIYRVYAEMVRSQDMGSNNDRKRRATDQAAQGIDDTDEPEVHGKKGRVLRGKFEYIRQQIQELLQKKHVSPISAVLSLEEVYTNAYLSNPKHKDFVSASLNTYSMKLITFLLRDFENLICDVTASPLFIIGFEYYNLEESVTIIDNLLKFQFDDNEDEIVRFLTNLVNIIDKRIPKRNCIVIKSPPSGGKNFFFDMVLGIVCNYGQLGQANRNNVFAFQEAPNKRLLLWNEPNYESALTDTLKLMMAGDPFTVRVKHSVDMHVTRTPVIVLTNNDVDFMCDPAFRDRIYKYVWKRAPFLAEYTKKPIPVAFFKILNKYNVDY